MKKIYLCGQLQKKSNEIWLNIVDKLEKSDGIILVTPEYNGMATPLMKNFLLWISSNQDKILAHKPTLLVSVSSGRSGSYPIAELRSFGFKNSQLCFLPDHLILREMSKDVLNEDLEITNDYKLLEERINYMLYMLNTYSKAFVSIRENEKLLEMTKIKFGYGM